VITVELLRADGAHVIHRIDLAQPQRVERLETLLRDALEVVGMETGPHVDGVLRDEHGHHSCSGSYESCSLRTIRQRIEDELAAP
jgi:hypothetical protein